MADSGSDLVVVNYAQHSQLLIDGLWKFLNSKYRVENVSWGGGFLQAHQLILDIFLPPERIVGSITISDDHQSHLEAMLEFLYRGKAIVKREKLEGLLLLAKEMDFQLLMDAIQSASEGGQNELDSFEMLGTDVRSCSVLLERMRGGKKADDGAEELPELENESSVGRRVLKSRRKGIPKRKRDSSSESEELPSSDDESFGKRVLKRRRKGIPKRKMNSLSEVLDDEESSTQVKRTSADGTKDRDEDASELSPSDKIKSSSKKHKCPDCKFESNNALVIDSHRAALHSGDKPHKCSQCSYATCWKRVLKRHVELEHTAYPCECNVCGQQIASALEMDKHMPTHGKRKNPVKFKCPHCDEIFDKKRPLNAHVVAVHTPVNLTCETCGRSFKSLGNLVEHRRTHSAEKRYLCPTCGKGFHQSHGLKDHIRRVHDKGPGLFVCDTCGRQSKTRNEMVSHQRIHCSEKPYKCPHCQKAFNHKSNMNMHVMREHKRDKNLKLQTFACDVCGKSYGSRGYLTAHKRTHTQERPYKCPHCDKCFNQSGNRSAHVAREHSDKLSVKSFVCEFCSKAFKTRGNLVEHRRTHTQERPYRCPYCGKGFNQSSQRNGHVARVHPPDSELSYACDECGKQLGTLSGLIKHRMTHHTQERPYKCPHCEMDFNHPSKMNYHISRVHTVGTTAASYVCEFCGKHYNYRNGLVAHRRTHNNMKTHKCSQCSFATGTNSSLAAHMDVVHHVGPGRFACDLCGKRLCSSADLKRHNMTHTKEKPFQCEHCPYSSSQKSTMKQHVDVNHGVGRFRCETCGKAVHSASLLTVHQRTHTQERPFQCPHCDLRVSRKENLTRHIDVVHGTEKHTCETCDKTFKSSRQLTSHRRKHLKTDKKPKPHATDPPEEREPAAAEGHYQPMHGAAMAPLACVTSSERCSLIEDFGGHRLAHTSESAFDIFQSILRP